MVEAVLELLGAEPGSSVVIGDSPQDIQASSAAGCMSIGLGVNGDFRAEKLKDIPDIVAEIRKGF